MTLWLAAPFTYSLLWLCCLNLCAPFILSQHTSHMITFPGLCAGDDRLTQMLHTFLYILHAATSLLSFQKENVGL
jgi:hypothetical protein